MKSLVASLSIAATLLATAGLAHAGPVTGQGTWETTLKARDIDGNAVALDSASAAFFYDTTLNVTWLANMNALGSTNWSTAVAWAEGLTTGGFDDWRLPTTIGSGADGCTLSLSGGTGCGFNVQTQAGGAYNEWAHLFYVTLGNLARYDTTGNLRPGSPRVDWGPANTGYFRRMHVDYYYWSGTAFGPDPSLVWFFDIGSGYQGIDTPNITMNAVAVRSGDVLRDSGTVPEPQSLALALTALAGLGLGRRRRRAA